ncbi:MAG: M28 family peptidase, partial [Acidobacteriota bacterium]
MRFRRLLISCAAVSLLAVGLVAQKAPSGPAGPGGPASIEPGELKEWLTYIASDELEGRQIFTEGLGLASAYIASHLQEWGVKPGAPDGTYFQTVKVLGVKASSHATVTVQVGGQTRTFKDGEGITFPRNMGAKQTITGEQIQFAGYGLQLPAARIDDYATGSPKGKIVIYIGSGPKTDEPVGYRLLAARSRNAIEKGALAAIGAPTPGGRGRRAAAAAAPADAPGASPAAGSSPAETPPAPAAAPTRGFTAQPDNGDFTTVQRYDVPVAPALAARDDFFEFLFSGSDVTYAELKEKSQKQEPLPTFALKGVKVTINVDADYTVVRTRLTRNVVGIVPGTDASLNDTYVAFGAHYDHIGYSETGRLSGPPISCPGQTRDTPREGDTINNGADDDGSGTVALMALAKAFALGPKPKRSVLLMWHSGEEAGLYGSRYNADHPVVPLDKMAAQLNIDMIGRNNCDDPKEENTVYIVGSDRISTELHNLDEEANASLATPMTLDYALNDPADPESIYTRSDHYSYASKGIPIIFYTTGLHKDYHYVTDEVSKIDFPK